MARPSRAGALTTQTQALRERPRERTPQASCLAGTGIASLWSYLLKLMLQVQNLLAQIGRLCLLLRIHRSSIGCRRTPARITRTLRLDRRMFGAGRSRCEPTYLLPRRRLGAPPLYLPPLGLAQLLHLPLQSRRPAVAETKLSRADKADCERPFAVCALNTLNHTGCSE